MLSGKVKFKVNLLAIGHKIEEDPHSQVKQLSASLNWVPLVPHPPRASPCLGPSPSGIEDLFSQLLEELPEQNLQLSNILGMAFVEKNCLTKG